MDNKAQLFIVLALLALIMKSVDAVFTGKPASNTFDPLFVRHSKNPKIAKAVAMVESDLNPSAIGDAGKAFGLMQIWYPTAQGHGYEGVPYGLLEPEVNIFYASKELDHLIETYGTYKGIMGYNIGETQLRKGAIKQEYFDKVQAKLGQLTLEV